MRTTDPGRKSTNEDNRPREEVYKIMSTSDPGRKSTNEGQQSETQGGSLQMRTSDPGRKSTNEDIRPSLLEDLNEDNL